jgi:hypothetical protein
MAWAATAAVAGSLISANSASKAAKRSSTAQLSAAQMQSDASRYAADIGLQGARAASRAQIKAAEIAAEAARFRPYGITTGFGTSRFDTNKDTGTYDLDPRLAAFRDQYYSGAQGVLGQMQGYDPQAMARTVYGEQQALLDPSRQAENEALRASQLSSGRIGLGLTGSAVGAGTGGMLNPQQFSLDRARAQADAQMAFNSREYGQAELDRLIGRGTGLMNTGFGIEELGAKSLAMGLDAGSRAGVSQGNQAQALLSGGMGAAQSMLGGTQAQMRGITDSANTMAQGQLGASNTLINARLARDQALIGALSTGAGMFGGAFSGNYNPGNWSNPAGSSGFYKYGGSNLDVGNMS